MMDAGFFTAVLWEGLIGATLASVGFGVLFNVRGKALALAGITGGIGGLGYKAALEWNLGDPMSNFLAAIAISILGEIFARKLKTTVTTFTACALIPLVPGGTAYEMMVEFSQNHPLLGLSKLMDVITISGMLAIGILFVSTLTRFFFYSKRKIHSTREFLFQRNPFENRKNRRSKTRRIKPGTLTRRSAPIASVSRSEKAASSEKQKEDS